MRPSRGRAQGMTARQLHITRIGADGDGVAMLPDAQPVFIAGTLPGEVVRAAVAGRRATLDEVLSPSLDRAVPPCLHFGDCGGCALQHWQDDAYAAWKRELLITALHRAGFAEPKVAPLIRTPAASRRRIDLALYRQRSTVQVGLHRRQSQDVVDLTTCAVLHPRLLSLLPPLRAVLTDLHVLRRQGAAVLNLLDTGPDLLLRTDAEPDAEARIRLAAFARDHALPRISWALGNAAPEPVCSLRPATIALSGVILEPPPGAFLQASAEGEAGILAAVLDGLPPARPHVIELYAGCGTLSFALARRARVSAFEGDAALVAALRRAAQGMSVHASQRDLARQPLQAKEMAAADVVVLDPPFTGAASQMPAIAQSGAARVIYVSCNPAALARDARVLREAGYALLAATPIDQFLWSSRLESVCVFTRPRRPRRAA